MPRLSLLGEPTLMGPGAGPMRTWLTEIDTIEQSCIAGCELLATNTHTGVQTVQSLHGANWLQAGASVWAARLQGFGYFDSFGRTNGDFIPLAVDPTSGAVFLGNYTAGAGLWIWWPDGHFDTVSTVIPDIQQGDYRGGVAVYRAGGLVQRWPQGDNRMGMADPRYASGNLVGNAPLGLAWFPWRVLARGFFCSIAGITFTPDVACFR